MSTQKYTKNKASNFIAVLFCEVDSGLICKITTHNFK